MKKRTKILLSLLFGVILLFHLAWAGNYFLNYRPYTKTVPMHESGEYFLMTDNYDLSVAMPSYPTFTGNLAITNKNDDLSFIIWPSIGATPEIGLQILGPDGVTYSVILDQSLNYDSGKNPSDMPKEQINQLIIDRRTEMDEMYDYAKKSWNL